MTRCQQIIKLKREIMEVQRDAAIEPGFDKGKKIRSLKTRLARLEKEEAAGMKHEALYDILEASAAKRCTQMRELIDAAIKEVGAEAFWADYSDYVEDRYAKGRDAFERLSKTIVGYHKKSLDKDDSDDKM